MKMKLRKCRATKILSTWCQYVLNSNLLDLGNPFCDRGNYCNDISLPIQHLSTLNPPLMNVIPKPIMGPLTWGASIPPCEGAPSPADTRDMSPPSQRVRHAPA